MRDWDSLTIEALRSLGADAKMVPGAKLRQRMVELGRENGFDVAEYVSRSTDSFSTLVRRVNKVVVQVRQGSDVPIGLQGVQDGKDAQHAGIDPGYSGLRKDVYEAFTRVSRIPFVYLPGIDRFVPESEAEGASVAVKGITLDDLIKDRLDFANTLLSEDQQSLIDALNGSANPLLEFRQEATNRKVFGQWADWQTRTIAARVREWAKDNNLSERKIWFQRTRTTNSSHQTLARLIPYLTADEIRDLHIPFRAVEALLFDQKR